MAFALTQFYAESLPIQSVTPYRGTQLLRFFITQLVTDTDCDIGDFTGTFWTDAAANATYGGIASDALTQLQLIVAQAEQLLTVQSEDLIGRQIDNSSPAGTDYSISVENSLPDIAFHSGDAPTTWIIECQLRLNKTIFPTALSVGSTAG